MTEGYCCVKNIIRSLSITMDLTLAIALCVLALSTVDGQFTINASVATSGEFKRPGFGRYPMTFVNHTYEFINTIPGTYVIVNFTDWCYMDGISVYAYEIDLSTNKTTLKLESMDKARPFIETAHNMSLLLIIEVNIRLGFARKVYKNMGWKGKYYFVTDNRTNDEKYLTSNVEWTERTVADNRRYLVHDSTTNNYETVDQLLYFAIPESSLFLTTNKLQMKLKIVSIDLETGTKIKGNSYLRIHSGLTSEDQLQHHFRIRNLTNIDLRFYSEEGFYVHFHADQMLGSVVLTFSSLVFDKALESNSNSDDQEYYCPSFQQQFQCDNTQCISYYLNCDGLKHCDDGSDEKYCNDKCDEFHFHCRSGGRCLNYNRRCDGSEDCIDGSDEKGCPGDITTKPPPMDDYTDSSIILGIVFSGGIVILCFVCCVLAARCRSGANNRHPNDTSGSISYVNYTVDNSTNITISRSTSVANNEVPPSYDEALQENLGQENVGFHGTASDPDLVIETPPPKYEEIAEILAREGNDVTFFLGQGTTHVGLNSEPVRHGLVNCEPITVQSQNTESNIVQSQTNARPIMVQSQTSLSGQSETITETNSESRNESSLGFGSEQSLGNSLALPTEDEPRPNSRMMDTQF